MQKEHNEYDTELTCTEQDLSPTRLFMQGKQ